MDAAACGPPKDRALGSGAPPLHPSFCRTNGLDKKEPICKVTLQVSTTVDMLLSWRAGFSMGSATGGKVRCIVVFVFLF